MKKQKRPQIFEKAALATVIMATGLPVTSVSALDDTSFMLEEIIVTSRKRTESIQDVPISITAISGDALQDMNIVALDDISSAAPNVRINRGGLGGTDAVFSIRGQYQQDSQFSFDSSVGLYVDDIYVARSPGAVSNLFDIDRIEVLKGPQGTLWGRNTPGGAVAVHTKSAEIDDQSGYLMARLGTDSETRLEGAVNIPLVEETAAIRLAAGWDQKDGWAKDHTSGDELGGYEDLFARVSLLVTPSEALSITFKADYHDYENERSWSKLSAFDPVPGANLAGEAIASATLIQGLSPQAALDSLQQSVDRPADRPAISTPSDAMLTINDRTGGNDVTQWGTALKIDYDISDDISISSITGYRDMERTHVTDADGTEFNFATGANDDFQDQISQEFKLQGVAFDNKLNWVTGLYYFQEEATMGLSAQQAYGLTLAGAAQGFLPGITPPTNPADFPAFIAGLVERLDENPNIHTASTENESIAVYAQTTYQFTDNLSSTVGYRYSEDTRQITINSYAQLYGTCRIGFAGLDEAKSIDTDNCLASFEDKYDGESWTIGLEYTLSENAMVYAKSSRGFRSGGRNMRGWEAVTLKAVDPETVTDIELGLKSEFMDNRGRLNVALFVTDYEDLQKNAIFYDPVTRQTNSAVENVQEATVQGAEIELSFVVNEHFEIGGTYGYIDAEYDEFLTSAGDDRSDEPFAYTPENDYSLYVVAQTSFGDWDVKGRLDYSFTDEINYGQGLPEEIADSYSLLAGRLTLSHSSSGWDISLWGRNLTDEQYTSNMTAAYGIAGFVTDRVGVPRSVGIEFKKTFQN